MTSASNYMLKKLEVTWESTKWLDSLSRAVYILTYTLVLIKPSYSTCITEYE
jgi:hypothetical protein